MPSVDVEQVIRNLPLSSGEVPIHCIKNAEDPIFFIGQLLKADPVGFHTETPPATASQPRRSGTAWS